MTDLAGTAHLIFFVADQQRSTAFYTAAFGREPSLNVPGMTEFSLNGGCVLGLMPAAGIVRLLGDAIRNPALADGIPRAELYLRVEDPVGSYGRAIAAGASIVSPPVLRDWGDVAGYVADPDGHIVAFAKPAEP